MNCSAGASPPVQRRANDPATLFRLEAPRYHPPPITRLAAPPAQKLPTGEAPNEEEYPPLCRGRCRAATSLAAEKYVFDKAHTEIEFAWDHLGFSTTSANFKDFDGALMFDEASPSESNVQVTIAIPSLDSNIPDLDEHLKGPDFFDAEMYPEATFESTAVRAVGDNQYEVDGNLTLHGHTEPVTLDVTINKIGMHPMTEAKTIGFDATTAVSRSAFDLGMYTPAVGDEVQIRISSEMPRESDL